MSVITFQRGDKTKLTTNFARYEFQCSCGCTAQMVDQELADKLQTVRNKIKKSIKITSGYRCLKHNSAVGGSKSSRHLYGYAADWRTTDRSINPVALGIIAQAVGFGGIGIYWHSRGAFVHCDTRNGKATWLCTASGSYQYTSYNAFILPTVKKGSTGATNKSAIIMLQKLLKIKTSGTFDGNTEQALIYAQKRYGITADGICGPQSWKYISGAYKYL